MSVEVSQDITQSPADAPPELTLHAVLLWTHLPQPALKQQAKSPDNYYA